MKVCSVVMTTLLLCGSLAFAQVCPPSSSGTVCLVPSRTPSGNAASYGTMCQSSAQLTNQSACGIQVGGITYVPISSLPSTGYPMMSMPSACPTMGACPSTSMTSSYPMYGAMPQQGYMQQGGGQTSAVPMSSMPMYSSAGNAPMTGMQGCPQGCPQVSSMPMTSMPSAGGVSPTSVASACSANASQDTACILNEMRALRGDILATSLQMQGQALVSRMDQLAAAETAFRQAIAANPNLPNAQLQATLLQSQAGALSRDIASYMTQLSLVPVEQRPYVASQLNSFDVAVWTPAQQRFANYQASFPQSIASYQPAFAANPWLQPWVASYQNSLTNIATVPQTYASTRWWSTTRVLGTTEVYQPTASNMVMLPSGAAIYIPAGSAVTMGTATAACPPSTTGAMGTTGVAEASAAGTMGTTGTTGMTGTTGGTAAGTTGTTGATGGTGTGATTY